MLSLDPVVIICVTCISIIFTVVISTLSRHISQYRRKRALLAKLSFPNLPRYSFQSLGRPTTSTMSILQIESRRLDNELDFPLDLLGAGTAGNVYIRHDLTSNSKFVAVKMFHLPDSNHVDNAILEIKTHSKIANAAPTVVPVIGYAFELASDASCVTKLGMVMEYVSHGNLEEYITLEGRGKMSERQICEWTRDIAEAIYHSHDNGVVNADVKSANVVITEKLEARIVDFGASVCVSMLSQDATGFFGTEEYDPPEVCVAQAGVDPLEVSFSHKVDTWAIGCVMYEMMTGELLTSTLGKQPLRRVLQAIPTRFSLTITKLLEWCLDHRVDKRASAAQILSYLDAKVFASSTSNTNNNSMMRINTTSTSSDLLDDEMEELPENIKRRSSRVRLKAKKKLETNYCEKSTALQRISPTPEKVSDSVSTTVKRDLMKSKKVGRKRKDQENDSRNILKTADAEGVTTRRRRVSVRLLEKQQD